MESNERQYYAYRADLKQQKTFTSTEQVMQFFKTTKPVIRRKSLGKVYGHGVGGNIGTRWFVFDAGLSHRYVSEYLELFKTNDIDLSGHKERQERKKKKLRP